MQRYAAFNFRLLHNWASIAEARAIRCILRNHLQQNVCEMHFVGWIVDWLVFVLCVLSSHIGILISLRFLGIVSTSKMLEMEKTNYTTASNIVSNVSA